MKKPHVDRVGSNFPKKNQMIRFNHTSSLCYFKVLRLQASASDTNFWFKKVK